MPLTSAKFSRSARCLSSAVKEPCWLRVGGVERSHLSEIVDTTAVRAIVMYRFQAIETPKNWSKDLKTLISVRGANPDSRAQGKSRNAWPLSSLAGSPVTRRGFWAIVGQVSFGTFRNTSTTCGSNWLPARRRIVSRADSNEEARRD